MSPARLITVLVFCLMLFGALVVGAQEPDVLVGETVRLSTMGPEGEAESRADLPAIAYNPVDDEFLVAWIGNEGVVAGDGNLRDQDIYGQRLDAATGEPVGEDDFRISFVGGEDGPSSFVGLAVTHNPEANEYLVAWLASPTITNPPFRVHVRRVDGATGELLGEQAIITDYETLVPSFGIDVVYNAVSDEYLVVWAGTDDSPDSPIERFEYEVYGQRLDSEANEVGPSKIRISQVMGDGRIEDANVEVFDTRVAHDPAANEYLVVWDALAFLGQRVLASDLDFEQYYIDQEYELFGQRLDAEGNEIGENDFLISAQELPGLPPEPLPAQAPTDGLDEVLPSRSDVSRPRVVHNPNRGEYLALWAEDGEENGLAEREFELFARRIAADGTFLSDKFQVTDHGPPGQLDFIVFDPNVAHDSALDHYLVTFNGADLASTPLDPDVPAEANGPVFFNELEIYGVWLDGDGSLLYADAVQLSTTGPPGDPEYDAFKPALAHAAGPGEFVVVWTANREDLGRDQVDFAGREQTIYEVEIFGQRILEPPPPPPPPPPPTTTTTTATTTVLESSVVGSTVVTLTSTPATTPEAAPGGDDSGGGGSAGLIVVVAIAVVVVFGGGVVLARRGRSVSG